MEIVWKSYTWKYIWKSYTYWPRKNPLGFLFTVYNVFVVVVVTFAAALGAEGEWRLMCRGWRGKRKRSRGRETERERVCVCVCVFVCVFVCVREREREVEKVRE